VEDALKLLGRVYYVNRLEDLLFLVVEVTEQAYGIGESFISLE
jgi:cob(I)alamin adenosyltransferase